MPKMEILVVTVALHEQEPDHDYAQLLARRIQNQLDQDKRDATVKVQTVRIPVE